jgi:preprotein translocase subunit SecE
MAKKDKPSIIDRLKRFWRETVGELRKVSWPTMPEALALTRIVLIVTFLMSLILGLMDFVFSQLIGLLFRA